MIYLAIPYSNQPDHKEVFKLATEIAAHLISIGLHVYSPITHCHPIHQVADLPKEFKFWRDYDFWFGDRCEAVWVVKLPGWMQSKGVTAEFQRARTKEIDVRYFEPHELLNYEVS